jgi:hypothetical protein
MMARGMQKVGAVSENVLPDSLPSKKNRMTAMHSHESFQL